MAMDFSVSSSAITWMCTAGPRTQLVVHIDWMNRWMSPRGKREKRCASVSSKVAAEVISRMGSQLTAKSTKGTGGGAGFRAKFNICLQEWQSSHASPKVELPGNYTRRYLPRRNENICPCQHLYMNVSNNSTCSCQKVERDPVPISWWMNRLSVACPQDWVVPCVN